MGRSATNNEMNLNYLKLLQGRYEAERLPKDFSPEHIAPDFAFNVLNRLGLLYRPVVDEHFLNNGGEKPVWPNRKSFAVCLTHDVDAVSLYSLTETLRARWRQISGSRPACQKIKNLLRFGSDLVRLGRQSGEKDPLHCYERWLNLENEFDARSTFFFWPGWSSVAKHHHTDCTYELYDRVVFDGQECTVADMIREIDRRGWEIGLHASCCSFDDADELRRQKDALEKALGHDLLSIRQHYLYYNIQDTPRVQAQAGFRYDSTLGFNDNVGFRFGTCYPWYLYDLKAEKELSIMEIPLIVQDGALLNSMKGLRLDEDTAFQYVVQMSEAVETTGGVLTLSWHPNGMNNRGWWNLHVRSLKYLQQQNPWFASVREVGEWWKRHIGTGK